jgi:hypothetical protein
MGGIPWLVPPGAGGGGGGGGQGHGAAIVQNPLSALTLGRSGKFFNFTGMNKFVRDVSGGARGLNPDVVRTTSQPSGTAGAAISMSKGARSSVAEALGMAAARKAKKSNVNIKRQSNINIKRQSDIHLNQPNMNLSIPSIPSISKTSKKSETSKKPTDTKLDLQLNQLNINTPKGSDAKVNATIPSIKNMGLKMKLNINKMVVKKLPEKKKKGKYK